MQSVLSRIWTRVAVSISYDDNCYTTGSSNLLFKTNKQDMLGTAGDDLYSPLDSYSWAHYCRLTSKIYIHQLCANTGCHLQDLLRMTNGDDRKRERRRSLLLGLLDDDDNDDASAINVFFFMSYAGRFHFNALIQLNEKWECWNLAHATEHYTGLFSINSLLKVHSQILGTTCIITVISNGTFCKCLPRGCCMTYSLLVNHYK